MIVIEYDGHYILSGCSMYRQLYLIKLFNIMQATVNVNAEVMQSRKSRFGRSWHWLLRAQRRTPFWVTHLEV